MTSVGSNTEGAVATAAGRRISSGNRPSLGWFHRYPARFPADTLGRILAKIKRAQPIGHGAILDPFAGTGATLAAARRMGYSAVGLELSQLGILIAQVRLDPPKDPELATERVERWVDEYPGKSRIRVPPELVDWTGAENAQELSWYLARLSRVRERRTRRFIQLALSAAIRPSSVWLPGSIKPQIDPNRTPPRLGQNLVRAVRALARDCCLEAEGASRFEPTLVIKGDAQLLPFGAQSVDHIVTSPPYFTMYDYFDVQRLTYLAFGWPREVHLQVGRRRGISPDGVGFRAPPPLGQWYHDAFGAERTREGRALRAYLQAIRTHLSEALRVVKSKGTVAYAMANSTRGARPFRIASAMAFLLREAGFRDVRCRRRTRVGRMILPAGRDPETGRFSGDHGDPIQEIVIYASRP